MKENKITFQSQNLIVDYITFKFQDSLLEKKIVSIH